jgi:hypothetical protein
MAAPPLRYILPTDVQGSPLARLLIAHPDVAAAVFAHLTYADATPLRAACRGFRGAVGEHPWSLPVPLPDWVLPHDATRPGAVCTPVGLARWRAAFPAGRTLLLVGTSQAAAPLYDADVAPAAAWGLAGVQLNSVFTLSRAGLSALCGPALTALCLVYTRQLSAADVAAATAASPRLRTLNLFDVGPLADADLAAWGGVQSLSVCTRHVDGFTWDGVRHLATMRELTLPLSLGRINWAGGAFCGLTHLTRLHLENSLAHRALANVNAPAGLFAPGSLPRSLRHVFLRGLALEWPPGVEPDGGVALLRPLAGVPEVALSKCDGVGDAGLCVLAGATRLTVSSCRDVAGEHLAPLGGALEELTVKFSGRFSGGGLGSLTALRRLSIHGCLAFRAGALVGIAAGCVALERVDVRWWVSPPQFDVAAAKAALRAATGRRTWKFTRGDGAWAATRRQRRASPALAGGGASGVPVAAAPAPAPAAGAAALSDDAPQQPARHQRMGE